MRNLVLATAFLATPAMALDPLSTPEDLMAMDATKVAIIDIRSPIGADMKKGLPESRDFSKGHIPGAVHAHYGTFGWRADMGENKAVLPAPDQLEAKIRKLGVDKDDTVVIVSAGDGKNRALEIGSATRVYWTFKALGHDAVTILDGGYSGWVAGGHDVSTDAVSPESGNFTADLQTDMLISGAMVEIAQSSPVQLMDSRPVAQFTAQSQSGFAKNPGTIQTSFNVVAASLVPKEGSYFMDADSMRSDFEKAGFVTGAPAYSFCNSGHWASVTWFAASELMGEDVELYDGSMHDWTYVRNMRTVVGKLPEAREK